MMTRDFVSCMMKNSMAYFVDQVFIWVPLDPPLCMCSCMGQVMGHACGLFSFRSRFAFCLISVVHGNWLHRFFL
jgi:hypothetical protein